MSYPYFLINIIVIALRGEASLEIFRGMKFARFDTGEVGVVPTVTEQGDFILTDSTTKCGQDCCMFRPKDNLSNETYSKGIRAEIDPGFKGFFTLGKAWVDCCSSANIAFVDRTRNAGQSHDVRVIAIH
ncbi:uncharacterized protein EAE97_010125 [Botrytis byssoidea]|uniref:Uncharacterized protein n=1 Tax=Botrytis byssoidea TaxID=139641 RepID=A0A9P5I7A2_9HELO|nr:uncharacterized protein EAE97_010125 [Botrytis byssoidea]KAF7927450.1 hypothetical protein EAE97_010125 [Botrytis byssoidea]